MAWPYYSSLHSSFGYILFLLFFGLRSFFFVLGDFVFVFAIINRASMSIVRQLFSNIYSSPCDRWVNWDLKKLNNYLIHSSSKCGSKLFLQLIIQYLFSSSSLAKEPKQLQIYPPQSSLWIEIATWLGSYQWGINTSWWMMELLLEKLLEKTMTYLALCLPLFLFSSIKWDY